LTRKGDLARWLTQPHALIAGVGHKLGRLGRHYPAFSFGGIPEDSALVARSNGTADQYGQ
jgi:hypothetical protein